MVVYIINGHVTIKKIYDRSHHSYFMGYTDTAGVILYWNPDQNILISEHIMICLMNIILISPKKTGTLQVLYYFNHILKFMFMIHTSST